MANDYQQRVAQLDEMIANGEAPPRMDGYSGINRFAAASSDTSNIMNEVVIQIHNMNGQVLLQEPFRVMWRVNPGNAVDTVFNAWISSHSLNQYVVHIDLVGGVAPNYLTMILPMIQALFANGTFEEMIRPFDEQEWRAEVVERITRSRQRDIDDLA